jgi:hypothetical protein
MAGKTETLHANLIVALTACDGLGARRTTQIVHGDVFNFMLCSGSLHCHAHGAWGDVRGSTLAWEDKFTASRPFNCLAEQGSGLI